MVAFWNLLLNPPSKALWKILTYFVVEVPLRCLMGWAFFMLLFILHSPAGFAPDAMGRNADFGFVLFFHFIFHDVGLSSP